MCVCELYTIVYPMLEQMSRVARLSLSLRCASSLCSRQSATKIFRNTTNNNIERTTQMMMGSVVRTKNFPTSASRKHSQSHTYTKSHDIHVLSGFVYDIGWHNMAYLYIYITIKIISIEPNFHYSHHTFHSGSPLFPQQILSAIQCSSVLLNTHAGTRREC